MLFTRELIEKREIETLAPYAVKSGESAGRVYLDCENEFRTCFQRDRDRIIHSKAFRRLMEKTQVFVAHEGDHYRNRMSHSIECSQVSKGIARGLGLNEDLCEAIALAHDLGHTPFGHAGEAALDECMREYGNGNGENQDASRLHYEHNEQSLYIVEKLERMYPNFDGLNLTKEVLDGLLKHRTPFDRPKMSFKQSAHLEAQVVDLGDEIAYMSHDLDDGLRAGMFTYQDVVTMPLMARAEMRMHKKYGNDIAGDIVRVRLSSALMHTLVEDVLTQTEKNLSRHSIATLADVRAYDGILVQFSGDVRAGLNELRAFLSSNYYFSDRVREQSERGQKIIRTLFHFFMKHPEKLPEHFQTSLTNGGRLEVVVKDYIAGMTDGFAEWEVTRHNASV